jgi:hypothetical protein
MTGASAKRPTKKRPRNEPSGFRRAKWVARSLSNLRVHINRPMLTRAHGGCDTRSWLLSGRRRPPAQPMTLLCTCHDELLIMMILLPNMMQSVFIFGFNVQFLCVRANRAISTGDIGQALVKDVERTMLFTSGCTDSERSHINVYLIRSRIPILF